MNDPMPTAPARPAPRLQPIEERSLAPFHRAAAVDDASVYWMPVTRYPMLPPQREWLLEFQRRLAAHLRSAAGLREECFLQFKSLYPDLLDRFTETNGEYIPMTGAALIPGTTPPAMPDLDTIRQQVENSEKSGEPIDVAQWMPEHLHWFLIKKAEAQRADFFGYGGMLTLYLAQDESTVAPVFEMPRIVRTHPAYSDDMQTQIQAAYSLRDPFLARSKDVFGEPFRRDPSFKGLMFVLPLFTGATLVGATAEDRALWFSVFDGYLIESKVDGGILLAIKDPKFDDTLWDLLQGMRDDAFEYIA